MKFSFLFFLLIFLNTNLGLAQTQMREKAEALCRHTLDCIQQLPAFLDAEDLGSCLLRAVDQIDDSDDYEKLIQELSEVCDPQIAQLLEDKVIKFGITKKKKEPKIRYTFFDLSKMRIFYEGIDNPISVVHPKSLSKTLRIEVSSGELKKTVRNYYTYKPDKPGILTISCFDGDRLFSRETYRVKVIPDPVFFLRSEGESPIINKDKLGAVKQLLGQLVDFDWYVVPQIESFKIKIVRAGQVINEANNTGAKISIQNQAIINNTQKGDVLLFENINYILIQNPKSDDPLKIQQREKPALIYLIN